MITRYRGDTHPIVFQLSIVKPDASIEYLENVVSVDFTYIKKTIPIVLSGVITDVAQGLVRFDILPSVFDTVVNTTFDIQAIFIDGTKRTFIRDNLKITDDVNKL